MKLELKDLVAAMKFIEGNSIDSYVRIEVSEMGRSVRLQVNDKYGQLVEIEIYEAELTQRARIKSSDFLDVKVPKKT